MQSQNTAGAHAKGMDEAFGNWLAGFIDGEGCFSVLGQAGRTASCRLVVALRDDDRPILEEIAARTGCGRLWERRRYNSMRANAKPQAIWGVHSRADTLRMVEILDRHPLRAKKRRDYAIWREAVIEWHRLAGKRDADRRRFYILRDKLKAVREYQEGGALCEVVALPLRRTELDVSSDGSEGSGT